MNGNLDQGEGTGWSGCNSPPQADTRAPGVIFDSMHPPDGGIGDSIGGGDAGDAAGAGSLFLGCSVTTCKSRPVD